MKHSPFFSAGSVPMLCPNRPVIHHQALHWKVSGIAGRPTRAYSHGGSCNETVGLAESYTATGKLAPPPAGLFPLNSSEGASRRPFRSLETLDSSPGFTPRKSSSTSENDA